MTTFRTMIAAVTLTIGFGGAALAAPVACDELTPDVTNLVTLNDGCLAMVTPDNDSAAAVAGFFDVATWTELGRTGGLPDSDGPLTITGDKQSGTWSIAASVFTTYDRVMLVFKGADQALPDAVIAYLVSTTSGDYKTPFFDTHKDGYKEKDISHVTLYGGMIPTQVPVPAAGVLMLTALGGLGLMRRRKG